jgi:hypothetical protein
MNKEISIKSQGSMSAELAVIAPLIMLLLVIITCLGRFYFVTLQLKDAARVAADTAAIQGYPAAASLGAREAALSTLYGDSICENGPVVSTNTSDFIPGGFVKVEISCNVSALSLPFLNLPITVSVDAVAPIDKYVSIT